MFLQVMLAQTFCCEADLRIEQHMKRFAIGVYIGVCFCLAVCVHK